MSKKQSQVIINYVDLARILVREHKITEGHWHVALTFGNVGGIIAVIDTGKGSRTLPSALVPVLGISLLRVDQPNALTVDAAVVNPPSRILTPGSSIFN
jgi:hypothetical protein